MTRKAFTANYLPTTHHKCRSNFFFIDFYKFSSVFFLFTLHVSLFIHTRDVFRSITIIWKHSKEDLCIFLFYTTHNRDKMLFRIVDNSVSVKSFVFGKRIVKVCWRSYMWATLVDNLLSNFVWLAVYAQPFISMLLPYWI